MADRKQPPTRRSVALGRCPICNALARQEARPFCSRRCADVDLGRWFTDSYRMPTDERLGRESFDDPDGLDDDGYPNHGG